MDNGLIGKIPNMNLILDLAVFEGMGHERVKSAARGFLDELRGGVLSGVVREIPTLDECAEQIISRMEDIPHLRGLINATGIVLHTNLGRAPLGAEQCACVSDICAGYCNLEYDLETGRRGSRYTHVEDIICQLTGAEAAMVTNNNAAAVFLMLSTLAKGKRVAISRGELVEIGGSFRVPEIMEQSGAELLEVGTTNKTRLSDYAAAVREKGAGLLLKVHASNYQIVGFVEDVPPSELAAFGKENGLPVLYDMGSCFMIKPELLGIRAGESARSGIEAGMDLVCFSGDKLLGSAQAGIIAGRGDYIAAMKKNPFTRMMRPDKMALAALEAALRIYRYPDEAKRSIPALAMLSARPEELRQRAESLAQRILPLCHGWEVSVCETTDEAGGGALPTVVLPGWAVALRPEGISVGELEERLRRGPRPVIIRIHDAAALISLRTVLPHEEDILLTALRCALEVESKDR